MPETKKGRRALMHDAPSRFQLQMPNEKYLFATAAAIDA
ncbi:hypothetical protein BSLA_02r3421 [Burkholderia stabilis]|nr:hypothetical protein BSLA_02r3421 [Burkholderia stabilis]